MTRLFVVRHGNTFGAGEPVRRIGSRTDLPLVPGGVEQAIKLGDNFAARGIRFDQAFSGPLKRTAATACHLLSRMHNAPPVTTLYWLAEIDHGPDEGEHEALVARRVGREALFSWERDGVLPAGWTADVHAIVSGWQDVLDSAVGDTLVVTSSGTAKFVFRGCPDVVPPSSLKLATGAFAEFEKRATGAWVVTGWNIQP